MSARWMEPLGRDIRYGFRVLWKNPMFSALVILAMGLGAGAATLMFSVVNAALLKPFEYRDPDRLVMIWDQLLKLRILEYPSSMGIYEDYRERARSFEDIAAFVPMSATAQFAERAERVQVMQMTANLPSLVGVPVALGRGFQPGEDRRGKDTSAILSDGLWRRRFGADPAVLGKALIIENRSYTIAGVMPPGFRFRLTGWEAPDVWLPVPLEADPNRIRGALRLLGRLKPDVPIEQARAEMKSIARALSVEFRVYQGPRGEDAGYTAGVVTLRDQLFGSSRRSLVLLFCATILMLVIAGANVAQLFMEWRAKREQELAIRYSLGASQGRIWRQLTTESILLSLLGGVVGLALSFAGSRLLYQTMPHDLSALDGIPIDFRVLVFTGLVCCVSGLIFGILPGHNPELLRASGSRVSRGTVRGGLVMIQACLSLVLLIGSGLLLRSLARLGSVDPGFRSENILTAQISLPQSQFRERHEVRGFTERLIDFLRRQPEIRAASVSSRPPFSYGTGGDPFSIEGRNYEASGPTPQFAHFQTVAAGYFSLLGIPLKEGRDFDDRDRDAQNPVSIVNETLARGFFTDESPLGKRIMLGAPRPGIPWRTIVGVVSDVRTAGLAIKPIPQIYEPYAQSPARWITILVSTRVPPERYGERLQQAIASFDREQPVYAVLSMQRRIQDSLAQPRFRTALFTAFGALAFFLAAFGVYSVTTFRVTRRTREIGIRMALGANEGSIHAWIVGQSLLPVAFGLLAGWIGSFGATRLLAGLLYEISPVDPIVYAVSTGVFLFMTLLASYLPARRAARLNPSATLRVE